MDHRLIDAHPNSGTLAERLFVLRNEYGHLTQQDLVERRARETIAAAFHEAGRAFDDAFLERAERLLFEPDRGRPLYPGARELLEFLRSRDLRIGLISNWSSHWIVTDIVATAGVAEFFSPLISSASFGRIKPHPAIFQHVLGTWSLDSADVVMVGDTLVSDILGAERVGMRSILVEVEPNPANATAEATVRPSHRVRHLREIPSLVGLQPR